MYDFDAPPWDKRTDRDSDFRPFLLKDILAPRDHFHGWTRRGRVMKRRRTGIAAKSESVTVRGSVWSWSRAREAVVVFAAGLTCIGVLLAGLTYTVQPLREDVRVLQATMVEVRERLVRVEEGQARLEEDIGRILVLLARQSDG